MMMKYGPPSRRKIPPPPLVVRFYQDELSNGKEMVSPIFCGACINGDTCIGRRCSGGKTVHLFAFACELQSMGVTLRDSCTCHGICLHCFVYSMIRTHCRVAACNVCLQDLVERGVVADARDVSLATVASVVRFIVSDRSRAMAMMSTSHVLNVSLYLERCDKRMASLLRQSHLCWIRDCLLDTLAMPPLKKKQSSLPPPMKKRRVSQQKNFGSFVDALMHASSSSSAAEARTASSSLRSTIVVPPFIDQILTRHEMLMWIYPLVSRFLDVQTCLSLLGDDAAAAFLDAEMAAASAAAAVAEAGGLCRWHLPVEVWVGMSREQVFLACDCMRFLKEVGGAVFVKENRLGECLDRIRMFDDQSLRLAEAKRLSAAVEVLACRFAKMDLGVSFDDLLEAAEEEQEGHYLVVASTEENPLPMPQQVQLQDDSAAAAEEYDCLFQGEGPIYNPDFVGNLWLEVVGNKM